MKQTSSRSLRNYAITPYADFFFSFIVLLIVTECARIGRIDAGPSPVEAGIRGSFRCGEGSGTAADIQYLTFGYSSLAFLFSFFFSFLECHGDTVDGEHGSKTART